MQQTKPNFFIFTGGPGSGKTSLLLELSKRGYCVVPEVAREIIKTQRAIGGNATHTGNRAVYLELMLEASIVDFNRMLFEENIVFFDRGLPDLYSYSRRFCGGANTQVDQAIQEYRYNTNVFIFPPWTEIYCHDTERQQSHQEAVETYHAVQSGYTECGYNLVEVPKISIEKRAAFILKMIK